MLRSNLKPLQRLPATEALERFLVQEDSACPTTHVVEKSATSSSPKTAEENLPFPCISWSPEDEEEEVAETTSNSLLFQSNMSLCSKDQHSSFPSFSDEEMSLDSSSSSSDHWKQEQKRHRSGSSCCNGLHRCKRLASELCMLRSEEHCQRNTKRRSILTI